VEELTREKGKLEIEEKKIVKREKVFQELKKDNGESTIKSKRKYSKTREKEKIKSKERKRRR
jgi:hypothetical protein